MRVSLSTRYRLLQQDIDACDAAIRHLDSCKECTDAAFCPVGDELYKGFLLAQSRAKLLTDDTDVELPKTN